MNAHFQVTGIPPSLKAYRLLDDEAGLKLVVGTITAYLSEMQQFVSGEVDPFFYQEKKALDFRQAFVQVYQRHYVIPESKELTSDGKLLVKSVGNPVPVYMYKVPIHSCNKKYLVARGGERTCYSIAPPIEVWQHDFWSGKPTTAGCESKSKQHWGYNLVLLTFILQKNWGWAYILGSVQAD
jgi:hypothetical protein